MEGGEFTFLGLEVICVATTYQKGLISVTSYTLMSSRGMGGALREGHSLPQGHYNRELTYSLGYGIATMQLQL